MTFFYNPTHQTDHYGHSTKYEIQYVDNTAKAPQIRGQFDLIHPQTVATVTQSATAEMDMPIDLEELTINVISIMNGAQPRRQTTDFDFHYSRDEASVHIHFKDPAKGGNTRKIATITCLSKEHALPSDLGERLVELYDRAGNQSPSADRRPILT